MKSRLACLGVILWAIGSCTPKPPARMAVGSKALSELPVATPSHITEASPKVSEPAREPGPSVSDDELVELFPYAIVPTFRSPTVLFLPLPSSLRTPSQCLTLEQQRAPYRNDLPLDAFVGTPCTEVVSLLRALSGRAILLFDAKGSKKETQITKATIAAQPSAFAQHAIADGELTIAEVYENNAVIEVAFAPIEQDNQQWVIARLASQPLPTFYQPVKKGDSTIAEFAEAQFADFRKRVLEAGAEEHLAETSGAVFNTKSGILFFGDVEQGDPPCGGEADDYIQVSMATYSRSQSSADVEFPNQPLLNEMPVLVLEDPRGQRTLLVFLERYSGRPQIYRYAEGKLYPFVVVESVHPDNHPC